ncbi:MAG: hypothetical protein ACXVFL_14565 [Solirubrobacteraceae bacterium]
MLLAIAALGACALPASASAKPWNCEASVLDIGLGPQPVQSPITANAAQPECKTASAGGTGPSLSPLPISGNLLSARTAITPATGSPSAQQVTATGELGSLSVGPTGSLPVPIPAPQVPPGQSISIPGVGTLDITAALQALVNAPNVELVGAKLASATASAQCSGGKPAYTGSAKVGSLTVLGQEIPTDAVLSQAINVVGGGSVDPSKADISKIPLPAGITLDPALTSQIQGALDQLPNAPIPPEVAQLNITPSSQTNANGTFTQRGPRVQLALGGQSVLDLTLGRAQITGTDSCQQAVAQAQLRCTKRKLVLVDVLQRPGYARLYGVADRKYIGKRVTIRSTWNNRVVARPKVSKNGTFLAKGALPPRSIRYGNRARYQASIAREKSLRLKLFRRMLITQLTGRNGRVTIKGRVVLPLGRPVQKIVIKRRVSCSKSVTAKTLRPDSRGRFSVTLSGPRKSQTATYRLATMVRKNTRNPKLYPTFTLPRAVELR